MKGIIMILRNWTFTRGRIFSSVPNNKLVLTKSRIRYAAPPIGTLRWQKPQAPAVSRSATISATAYPPRCPQSNDAPMWVSLACWPLLNKWPQLTHYRPSRYNFNSSGLGNEDCLFLSVFTPANATRLPVLVWIRTSTPSLPLTAPFV